MNTAIETKQPSIDYCGIQDRRLLNFLGEILVHNRMPRSADGHEKEMLLGLLAYEYDGEDGRKSYHLTIRGHLVYDLLANNGKLLLRNDHEEW